MTMHLNGIECDKDRLCAKTRKREREKQVCERERAQIKSSEQKNAIKTIAYLWHNTD